MTWCIMIMNALSPLFLLCSSSFWLQWAGTPTPTSDEQREIVATINLPGWKHSVRPVYTVPNRRKKIYEEHGLNQDQWIMMESISQAECGNALWFCDNWSDIWPFQMNKIHRGFYQESSWYYHTGDYNSLFAFQLRWTLDRFKRKKVWWDMNKLSIIHNWNNRLSCNWRERKYCYSEKVKKIREELTSYYKSFPSGVQGIVFDSSVP